MARRFAARVPTPGPHRRSPSPPHFFSVLRTSPSPLKCDTPFPTLGSGGGGRSLLIYPCGKAPMKTPAETLRFRESSGERVTADVVQPLRLAGLMGRA